MQQAIRRKRKWKKKSSQNYHHLMRNNFIQDLWEDLIDLIHTDFVRVTVFAVDKGGKAINLPAYFFKISNLFKSHPLCPAGVCKFRMKNGNFHRTPFKTHLSGSF